MATKEETLNIKNILGEDIRSRSGGAEIESRIKEVASTGCTITLDFTGVEYISRSFADELCEISNRHRSSHIQLRGMSIPVRTMYDIVLNARREKRVRRTTTPPNVHTFTRMEDLSRFLMTV